MKQHMIYTISNLKRTATSTMLLAWALALSHPFQSRATMIGDDMTLDWRYPNTATHSVFSGGYPYAFTVGPSGTSFTHGYNAAVSIDITADTITIAFPLNPSYPEGTLFAFSSAPFNGAVFTDLTRDFLSVSVESVTALSGFGASRVWVDGNDLYVNFAGLVQENGRSSATLRVTTAAVPDGGSTGVMQASAFGLLFGTKSISRWLRKRCGNGEVREQGVPMDR